MRLPLTGNSQLLALQSTRPVFSAIAENLEYHGFHQSQITTIGWKGKQEDRR